MPYCYNHPSTASVQITMLEKKDEGVSLQAKEIQINVRHLKRRGTNSKRKAAPSSVNRGMCLWAGVGGKKIGITHLKQVKGGKHQSIVGWQKKKKKRRGVVQGQNKCKTNSMSCLQLSLNIRRNTTNSCSSVGDHQHCGWRVWWLQESDLRPVSCLGGIRKFNIYLQIYTHKYVHTYTLHITYKNNNALYMSLI